MLPVKRKKSPKKISIKCLLKDKFVNLYISVFSELIKFITINSIYDEHKDFYGKINAKVREEKTEKNVATWCEIPCWFMLQISELRVWHRNKNPAYQKMISFTTKKNKRITNLAIEDNQILWLHHIPAPENPQHLEIHPIPRDPPWTYPPSWIDPRKLHASSIYRIDWDIAQKAAKNRIIKEFLVTRFLIQTKIITYRWDTGVIGEHQARNSVTILNIGTTFGHCHLNTRWSPGNKLCQLLLADPLQWFVDLRWIHLSLDDVQNRYVHMMIGFIWPSGYHHVLWLQQATHHIQNCRLLDISNLLRKTGNAKNLAIRVIKTIFQENFLLFEWPHS